MSTRSVTRCSRAYCFQGALLIATCVGPIVLLTDPLIVRVPSPTQGKVRTSERLAAPSNPPTDPLTSEVPSTTRGTATPERFQTSAAPLNPPTEPMANRVPLPAPTAIQIEDAPSNAPTREPLQLVVASVVDRHSDVELRVLRNFLSPSWKLATGPSDHDTADLFILTQGDRGNHDNPIQAQLLPPLPE